MGRNGEGLDPQQPNPEQVATLLESAAREGADATTIDDEVFLRAIASASKSQIESVMQGDARPLVLAEIFRRMGRYIRPERVPPSRSVVHWRIGDRPDGGYDEYEVVVGPAGVSVSSVLQHEPRVTLTTGPVEFIKLIAGRASGPMLFMTGKLKIKGDLGYAAGLTSIFAIPKAG